MNREEKPTPIVILDPVSGEYISFVKILNENNIWFEERKRTEVMPETVEHKVEFYILPKDIPIVNKLRQRVDEEFLKGLPSFCPKCDGERIKKKNEGFKCDDCGYEWKN